MTELLTTTTKQSFIKLTGENWDIYKFQTLNYFYEVEGDDIITGKEKHLEEMILEEESELSSSVSSSSLLSSSTSLSARKQKGTLELVEERKKEIKIYQAKVKKMYLYLVNTQSEQTVSLVRNIERGNAIACWKTLTEFYESKSLASIKQLMSQLIRTRYDASSYQPGLTLKFADEIERIADLLRQAIATAGLDVIDVLKTLIFIPVSISDQRGPYERIDMRRSICKDRP